MSSICVLMVISYLCECRSVVQATNYILITFYHGRLARWIKWRACDVGEAKEGLENELWRRWSNGRFGEWAVTYVKRRKGWRMSCDVDEVRKGWRMSRAHRYRDIQQSSFSTLSATSATSQLILQPFRRFTYVTAHSPSLPLLHLRHGSFSNPSFASPTSRALHLRHLASRPCSILGT